MKNSKGITLIALVITIIVLLILAGVSISAITGENGIVEKARDAAEKTEEAEKEEQDTLKGYEEMIDNSLEDSNIIKFKIEGIEYQAEDGMTWGEWIVSEYNIDNYKLHGYFVVTNITAEVVEKQISDSVLETQESYHEIEADVEYILKTAVTGEGEED